MAFAEWLLGEMKAREWSQSDLARYAGLERAIISKIVNQVSDPAPDTLTSLARALKLPPEIVFRAAGLLPEVSPTTEYMERMYHLISLLPEEQKFMLKEYALFLLSQVEAERSRKK